MKWLPFIFLIMPVFLQAQPNLPPEVADSLWDVWKDEGQPDTNRLKAIHKYAWDGYLYTQPDSAYHYAQLHYKLAKGKGFRKQMADALNTMGVSYVIRGDYPRAIDHLTESSTYQEEIGDKQGLAATLNNIGVIYKNQGNYAKALDYYSKSLKIQKEIGKPKAIATSLNNVGVIYYYQGNYAKAIDYYTRSLKVQEKTGNQQGIANCLNNIGAIYDYQGNYEKALEYYIQCSKIQQEIGDQQGLAGSLLNIGGIYFGIDEYDKAMDYYNRSLQIAEELGDPNDIASSLSNMGSVYRKLGNPNQALDYYTRSLNILRNAGDQQGIANSLNNIGSIYSEQGKTQKALDYCTEALEVAQDIGVAIEIKNAAKCLFQSNKKLGRYSEALEMYELYISTRDSILSEENEREIIRQEYKYEYEQQATADSIKAAEAAKVKDAKLAAERAENRQHELESRQQRQQMYSLLGVLGLALIFGGVIYNRFRITNKQKDIIQGQKQKVDVAYEQLEEKNQEILDSINYAKRIQSAILPTRKLVKEYLNESFVLYKPKDIVAGDFYWLESYAEASNSEGTEDLILFAACDCTGHGVPGAMVSVVCNNGLNRSVREHGLTEPGAILNKTREIVIKEFEKSEEEVKDGMDVALCSLSLSTLSLHFAGANNPLWIIRKGASEVEEIKGNKMPIGKYAKETSFDTHEVLLQKGDSIYIFSDGFVDQFGGKKGKKFKPANFKKLLLSIQQEPMEQQRELIDEAFEQWRGDLEQLDDVCVLGVRL